MTSEKKKDHSQVIVQTSEDDTSKTDRQFSKTGPIPSDRRWPNVETVKHLSSEGQMQNTVFGFAKAQRGMETSNPQGDFRPDLRRDENCDPDIGGQLTDEYGWLLGRLSGDPRTIDKDESQLPFLLRCAIVAVDSGIQVAQDFVAQRIKQVDPALEAEFLRAIADHDNGVLEAVIDRLQEAGDLNASVALYRIAYATAIVGLTPPANVKDAHNHVMVASRFATELSEVERSNEWDAESGLTRELSKILSGWLTSLNNRQSEAALFCLELAISTGRGWRRQPGGQTNHHGSLTEQHSKLDGPSIIVCPAIPLSERSGSFDRKGLFRRFDHVIGQQVPLIEVPDLRSTHDQLVTEYPYASRAVHRLLTDLSSRKTVRLKPTIVLGPPGTGKTRLVRRLGELLGCHVWRSDASRSATTAFAGTERRYDSAEPSHPLIAIAHAGHANPLLLLDEIEKAPTSSRNGNFLHVLLPFLEHETSRRILDPALQTETDLSHISFLATANSLDGIPGPLRDRFRIIEIDPPSREHLPVLVDSLIVEFTTDHDLDPRFVEPLTSNEMDLLAENWHGGSMRQLKRLIEVIIQSRDHVASRH